MAECEFIAKCPVFEKCTTGALKNVFITNYCKGYKMEKCARRVLKLSGKEIPENLLPNGDLFDFGEDSD